MIAAHPLGGSLAGVAAFDGTTTPRRLGASTNHADEPAGEINDTLGTILVAVRVV